MKWIVYVLGSLLLLGGLTVGGYVLMPNRASWAEDFTAYSQTLPAEAPLRQQMKPLLADGKLSLWELSQIHCEFKTGCTMDNFLSSYTHPDSLDMFATMTLEILKAQKAQSSANQ